MSIMPDKFRSKDYKGAQDWLTSFVDGQVKVAVTKTVTTKAEDGTETTSTVDTAKTTVSMDALFALGKVNNLNVDKYADQVENKNAPGRLRMTIGNMLRAAARKRHGLFDVNGEWHAAPDDFVGDAELKENRDGTKIAKVKAAETAEPAKEDADAA